MIRTWERRTYQHLLLGYSCFPHNLHSTPSKPRTLRLQIHSSPAPSKQGSLQHPGPGGNPHDSRGQKEPCLRELDEGLSGTGRAFWAYSPVQSGTAQNTRPSLGQLLNEPYYSLMRLLSVRLSGEGVERENALGYQANLSTWHQISTCWLCLCALSLSRGLSLSCHLHTESAHWGKGNGPVPTAPQVLGSPPAQGPMCPSPWVLGEVSTSSWGRDLRRVSTFFSIHPG